MEAKAIAKTVRISALKSRLVMRLINGKNVSEAMAILNNLNNKVLLKDLEDYLKKLS